MATREMGFSLGFRRMSKRLHSPLATLAILLAACSLAACGGDAPKTIPSDAVASIGGTPITKATLSHWMNSITGGDIYERFLKRAPLGLVSEPANYAACERAATSLTLASGRKPPFTSNQIAQKCRQLYLAIREQSLLFLISVQWRVNEAKENGITVSDGEVAKSSREYNAKNYPKPGEFETYLANHEWVASDVLYQLKRNLLTTKLHEKLSGSGAETPQTLTKFVHFVEGNLKKRTAETHCLPAYAVSTCRGYKAPTSATPAPALILEELIEK
jgi:hypothetical protein